MNFDDLTERADFKANHRLMVIKISVPRRLELTDEVIENFAGDAAETARDFLRSQRDAVPA